jgi:hypothetical protein
VTGGPGGAARRHTLPRIAARFLIGHHLDGRRRSDATFWSDGTTGQPGYWGSGRESRWVLLAGWKRAAVRLVLVLAAVGMWRAPGVTEWAFALVGGPLAGVWLWGRVTAVRRWRHRRTLEQPLALALAPFLGTSPREVEARLRVEPGFEAAGGGEHVAALELPDHWAATADQKARVQEVVSARLGIDVKWSWRTSQYPMVLNATRAPTPPTMVRWADVLGEIEACPPGKVLLGVDSAGEFRYGDLGLDDPHWAVNAGSRRGKTSLLLSVSAQVLHQAGAVELPDDAPECCRERVTGIDPKRVSLEALAGVPGVELYHDPREVEAMWAGIARFREFMDERVEAYQADRTVEFRRALLVMDELNQLSAMWDHHWRQVKEKSDPATPPVWDDVAAVAWMGAQFRCNIIGVGQRLDQGVLKGLRDSFGVRLLAGYTPQQYAFLVGLPPYPRPQKPRGRFLLFEGGELSWLQLVKADDPDGDYTALREYALAGRLGPAGLGGRGSHATVTDTALVGLREAVERGVLGCTLDAARRARADDPGFPPDRDTRGQEKLYAAGELRRWESARPRAGARRFTGDAA